MKQKKVKRRAKETCWRQIGADLENDLNGTKKYLYSLATNQRGKSSERVITYSHRVKLLMTDGRAF